MRLLAVLFVALTSHCYAADEKNNDSQRQESTNSTSIIESEFITFDAKEYLGQYKKTTGGKGSFSWTAWRGESNFGTKQLVLGKKSGFKIELENYRALIDEKAGSKKCKEFTSETIAYQQQIKSPVIFWQSLCVNNSNSTIKIVQLAIQGDEALHHLQMQWKNVVPKEDVANWIDILSNAYLCQSSDNSSGCQKTKNTKKSVTQNAAKS